MGCHSSHDTFCSVQSLSPTEPCPAEVPTPCPPHHPTANGCFVLLSPERCPRGVQEKPAQPCLLHKERAQRVSALTHAIIISSPSALMHIHPSPQLLQQMLLPGFCTPSSGDGGLPCGAMPVSKPPLWGCCPLPSRGSCRAPAASPAWLGCLRAAGGVRPCLSEGQQVILEGTYPVCRAVRVHTSRTPWQLSLRWKVSMGRQ